MTTELERYDAGLLSSYGGGDVRWWQDYIRAELESAHEFYQAQADRQPAIVDETPRLCNLLARIIDDASPCTSACDRLVDAKLIEEAEQLLAEVVPL